MLEATLNINFALPDGVSISYWLRAEEKQPDSETITVEEVATVLDFIYQKEPCEVDMGYFEPPTTDTSMSNPAGNFYTGDINQTTVEELLVPVQQSIAALVSFEVAKRRILAAFNLIGYDPCKYKQDSYDYETEIFIYRSHMSVPYNLVLNNGSASKTKLVEYQVDQFIKVSGDSITLDHTIHRELQVYSSVEVSSIDGSTVFFESTVIGYIRFKYISIFEKVTINVFGNDTEPLPCQCLIFYQEMVSEVNVNPPEEDEQAVNFLGCADALLGEGNNGIEEEEGGDGEEGDGDSAQDILSGTGNCFQRLNYLDVCRCSGRIQHNTQIVRKCSCDEPNSTNTYDAVFTVAGLADIEIENYISCPEEEQWTGGDLENFAEQCCETWEGGMAPLPVCPEITTKKEATYGIPYHAQGRSDVALVGPKDGDCGTITQKWKIVSRACCDDPTWTEIEYNNADSVDILDNWDSGVVLWDGGRAPYTVTVRGEGFFVDAARSKKELNTSGGAIRIYTTEPCGICDVIIEDNCNEVTGHISGVGGHWELYSTDPSACTASGEWIRPNPYSPNSYRQNATHKMYITQRGGWSASSTYCGQTLESVDCPPDHCESWATSTCGAWEIYQCNWTGSSYNEICICAFAKWHYIWQCNP